ncbi:MAG: hypothetical protein ACJ8C4_00325 [Gemmataceae bacterium]
MVDREYDLKDVLSWLPRITLVCSVFAACAGWANYAPSTKHSFPRTLALVFVGSLALLWVFGLFDVTPPRVKGIEHPFLYPSEAVLLFGVPATIALVLTVLRLRKKQTSSSETLTTPAPDEDSV